MQKYYFGRILKHISEDFQLKKFVSQKRTGVLKIVQVTSHSTELSYFLGSVYIWRCQQNGDRPSILVYKQLIKGKLGVEKYLAIKMLYKILE